MNKNRYWYRLKWYLINWIIMKELLYKPKNLVVKEIATFILKYNEENNKCISLDDIENEMQTILQD